MPGRRNDCFVLRVGKMTSLMALEILIDLSRPCLGAERCRTDYPITQFSRLKRRKKERKEERKRFQCWAALL